MKILSIAEVAELCEKDDSKLRDYVKRLDLCGDTTISPYSPDARRRPPVRVFLWQ